MATATAMAEARRRDRARHRRRHRAESSSASPWLFVRVWRGLVARRRPGDAQGQRSGDGALRSRRRGLPKLLPGALQHPWLVLGFAALAFALTLALVPTLGVDLIPQLAQDRFEMTVKLPPGTPLRETDQLVARTAGQARQGRRHPHALRRQRHRHAAGCEPDRSGENIGKLTVVMADGGSKKIEAAEIERLRAAHEARMPMRRSISPAGALQFLDAAGNRTARLGSARRSRTPAASWRR